MKTSSKQSDVDIFTFYAGKFVKIHESVVVGQKISQLLKSDHVFRFEYPEHMLRYYTENEKVFQKLKSEGKDVFWLHEIVENVRIKNGLSDVYNSNFGDLGGVSAFKQSLGSVGSEGHVGGGVQKATPDLGSNNQEGKEAGV